MGFKRDEKVVQPTRLSFVESHPSAKSALGWDTVGQFLHQNCLSLLQKFALFQFFEGLAEFGLGVHYNRSVPSYGFFEWLA
jgi:hypothetical protein